MRRLTLLLVTLVVLGSGGSARAGDGSPMLVATSIEPLADFIRQVGAARVEVVTLVPPGASPHTYELKPSQVAQVAHARLLVLNGAGLEYWAGKLVSAVANPTLTVIDTSEGFSLIAEGDHGANPHVWLDVRQAQQQVTRIRNALIVADPAGSEGYRARADTLLQQLTGLDTEIGDQVRTWSQRQFVAFHPAWAYFARRYDLQEAAVVEQFPGREPSPAEMVQIITAARGIRARAIFVEPQFSPKAAQSIADECGAQVVVLDPLGAIVTDGYIALMRYNVTQMAAMMK